MFFLKEWAKLPHFWSLPLPPRFWIWNIQIQIHTTQKIYKLLPFKTFMNNYSSPFSPNLGIINTKYMYYWFFNSQCCCNLILAIFIVAWISKNANMNFTIFKFISSIFMRICIRMDSINLLACNSQYYFIQSFFNYCNPFDFIFFEEF